MNTQGNILDAVAGSNLVIDQGKNLVIDLESFSTLGSVTSLDSDLIRIASYVYAADLSVLRLEREQHLRTLEVTIPIANYDLFERLRSQIENALTILSHDNWTIIFTRADMPPSSAQSHWPDKNNATLMFSGGLDSFCGAAHLLESASELTLVSHINHNSPVKNAQTKLAAAIKKTFAKTVDHLQVLIHGRNFQEYVFPAEREDTQRTRSFLFVAISAVAARLSGSRRIIVMAENGQFAIHLPLSEARVGSFSTHTAHPEFLAAMQTFLRDLYSCSDLEVTNPFLYLTKGEVTAVLPPSLRPTLEDSTSCWMASRIKESHCGICVPCLSRRVALEIHGIKFDEYNRDLLKEDIGALDASDNGKRNLIDMCQFIAMFSGPNAIASDDELAMTIPELLNEALDFDKAVAMYRRFSEQAANVFGRYPNVAPLLE
jgi:7-cyano-7-deazaguanine synthase in queuosine biosynthesis